MSITTITINATDYISYASESEADDYLWVDLVRGPSWTASQYTQGMALIMATRRLDMLAWQGEKTGGASQVNDWPRTGVIYPDGTAVSTTEVPQEVEDATILLAGTIMIDSSAALDTSNKKVQNIKAGSSSISYFGSGNKARNTLADNSAFNLIAIFLASSEIAITVGAYSGGKDEDGDWLKSTFEPIDRNDRTKGFG